MHGKHHHHWGKPHHWSMEHWRGHRMGWGYNRPRFMPFMALPFLFFMGFLFFGAIKFLWPLLLIGLVIFGVKMMMQRGSFGDPRDWEQRWHEWEGKRKRDWDTDDKRKNDDDDDRPQYRRTADGDIVQIV
jgi:hypothetical protein